MRNDGPDYDDPDVEETWCDERRQEVATYLQSQCVEHGRIGEWPAWHVAPIVSIWAIESASTEGALGYWVICGDLPTDCIAAEEASDPRQAMGAFAERWRKAAEDMHQGRASSTIRLGRSEDERRTLAPLLRDRATLLASWAARDDVWEGLFDDED